MTVDLRPMRLGEILDRTFRIYRSRFWAFFAIAAIPSLFVMALHILDDDWIHIRRLIPTFRQPQILFWSALISLGYYHVQLLIHPFFLPALIQQGSDAVFNERRSCWSSLRFSFAGWRSFLYLGFLRFLIGLIIPEALFAGILYGLGTLMDAMGLLNGDQNLPFIILFTVPLLASAFFFFWFCGAFALAFPVRIFESQRGIKALRRSWTLNREGRWRVAFTWLILFVISWILVYALELLVRWPFAAVWTLGRGRFLLPMYYACLYLVNASVAALVGPVFPIAATLFYYDQRIRKEGFDVEFLMQQAGMVPSTFPDPAAPPRAIPAPQEAEPAFATHAASPDAPEGEPQ